MEIHIDKARMVQLTRLPTIVEEPEWQHIKKCQECLSLFTELVREERGKKASGKE